MNTDDALDVLLRAHAPPSIADDGFTERTLSALPGPSANRLDAARALLLEQRRYATQKRHWRWATAGVVVGTLAVVAVVAVSPTGIGPHPAAPGDPATWLPVSLVLAAGSLWYAWNALRRQLD